MSVCVCTLQPLETDGAEEEDRVQQNETQSQPAVQPPAVQMDTQHLSRERERVISCCTAWNRISDSESENSVRALRPRQEEDQMKIIGEEKLLLMFAYAHVFIH